MLRYLSVVAAKLKQKLPAVGIPIFDQPIFADCEDVVCVGNKGYLQLFSASISTLGGARPLHYKLSYGYLICFLTMKCSYEFKFTNRQVKTDAALA